MASDVPSVCHWICQPGTTSNGALTSCSVPLNCRTTSRGPAGAAGDADVSGVDAGLADGATLGAGVAVGEGDGDAVATAAGRSDAGPDG
jgi:hypothetical protein